MSQTNKGGREHTVSEQQPGAQKKRVCISRDKHQSPLALIDSTVKAVFTETLSVTTVMMI